MVIRDTPPPYPRGPSCSLVLFVIFGISVTFFVIFNANAVREIIVPTPIPTPTRSATEQAVLAGLSERDGEYEEAIVLYRDAIRLDASRPEFYIRLINLLVREHQPEEAIEVTKQAVILAPDNDEVWIATASAYIANGDRLANLGDDSGSDLQYAEAVQAATRALNLKESATAYAYAAAGLVLQENPEKYQQAQEYADTAILLEPNNPIARLYMATVFTYQGFYSAAIEQYQLGIESDSSVADLHIGLARNYYGTSNIPDAILSFEDAILVDPDNAIAYDGLAFMYLQLGEDALAEEMAAEAVRLDPTMARAHGRLGEAFFRQSNYPEAILALEQAVSMYGTATGLNARFFNMLATAYVRNDLELCEQAVPLFQEVLALPVLNPLIEESALSGLEDCRLASLGG